ncbi:precorrin-3B C(17)-methyltransferase [Sediminispirochaeta smaragdinae]|uniref:Precorrin-3B C17-methyltransferase n=1 Tax=Sediminispirochaeta smaragdinae (strain DSM 11293 / JCM 15392 / SEBR 4228) TaxID=573413 RepID=E1R8K1_SEDSS|nr:precorrin-3B C(17)-methyltransferase [Sediminispirochaeta smaragdinae]ADK79345.1 precorrin-3B C17-methyltransferase [Sediminispirochaeta smaragdinae DSM 11293]
MKLAALCINEAGKNAAALLAGQMPDLSVVDCSRPGSLAEESARLFPLYEGLIFFSAVGIAVRMISGFLRDKYHDPAVVVVDNGCRNAVSLLSGHEGGANRLCWEVSRILGCRPVVSTATEARRSIVLGIGTRKDIAASTVAEAVTTALMEAGLSLSDVRIAATIGKKCLEPGLLEALADLDIPLSRVSAREISRFSGAFLPSAAARHIGIPAVAEPCALLAARQGSLIAPLYRRDGVTVAIARERIGPLSISDELSASADLPQVSESINSVNGGSAGEHAGGEAEGLPPHRKLHTKGVLYVVGIGPGSPEHMTLAAVRAIEACEVVVGYHRYLELLGELIEGKEIFASGMRKEKDRAAAAIDLARTGRIVTVVSTGDAGIYGMAGLILELAGTEAGERFDLRIIPGVTAASSAAALLGAPLMHDFAVISLSDLLTEASLIEKRLRLAAEGDFITVLYNPKSRSRKALLEKALDSFRACRPLDTPAAVVTNALREGQSVRLESLGSIDADDPDIGMSSVVVIGNSSSYRQGRWFITPRGYKIEEPHEG